jgi:hypothetical protein
MEDIAHRTQEGKELLADHLIYIKNEAEAYLGALKGFRRDLILSSKATNGQIYGEFNQTATIIAVPPLFDGMSFADLRAMLHICTEAFFGRIIVGSGPLQAKEIQMTHKNLTDVGETAKRLYESIKTAGFEFDVFNTMNLEAEHVECNILFNRDAMNVAMEISRALSEYAVRLDIDLM